jgi:Tfp pilus assembly protein PilF
LLVTEGHLDEAIDCFRKAIAIDSKSADAFANLGIALCAKKQLDEAAAACRKAIELNPKHAIAHAGLGDVLRAKKHWDQACAAYRKAMELDPHYAPAHHSLGMVLKATNQLDEAIIEFRRAITIDSKVWQIHGALGDALLKIGLFQEAKASTQQALDLLPEKQPLRAIVQRQLQDCERLLMLEAKLNDLLARNASAADNRERLGLIEVCNLKRLYLTAARYYADAFSADAQVADDLKASHRYNAACAAALAAAGQSKDTPKLDDKERTRLRQQALAWLRADLDLWSKRLLAGQASDREAARMMLQHWQADADLASLRDTALLRNLPPEEAASCRNLWADVADKLRILAEK